MPEFLSKTIQKIRDDIQVESNFMKKQATMELISQNPRRYIICIL